MQVSYNVVKESLINEITKTYDRCGRDVADSLDDEAKKVLTRPSLVRLVKIRRTSWTTRIKFAGSMTALSTWMTG